MLAGPNGAGKSSFFHAYLEHLNLPFLNADVLARETGLDAYAAAREIASIRDRLVERGDGFITETVLSDPVGAKVEFLDSASRNGFDVCLIFVGLEDAELSRRRVASRVKAGGHDVPEAKIFSRYGRTLDNLERAIAQLPRVLVYDNSSYAEPHRFIAEFRTGALFRRGPGAVPAWATRFVPPEET